MWHTRIYAVTAYVTQLKRFSMRWLDNNHWGFSQTTTTVQDILANFLSNWSIAWFITSWNSFMNSIWSAFQLTSDELSLSSESSWSLSWSGGDCFFTSHGCTFPVWLLDSPVASHLSVDRHCGTFSHVFGGISSTALYSITVSVMSQTFC